MLRDDASLLGTDLMNRGCVCLMVSVGEKAKAMGFGEYRCSFEPQETLHFSSSDINAEQTGSVMRKPF